MSKNNFWILCTRCYAQQKNEDLLSTIHYMKIWYLTHAVLNSVLIHIIVAEGRVKRPKQVISAFRRRASLILKKNKIACEIYNLCQSVYVLILFYHRTYMYLWTSIINSEEWEIQY